MRSRSLFPWKQKQQPPSIRLDFLQFLWAHLWLLAESWFNMLQTLHHQPCPALKHTPFAPFRRNYLNILPKALFHSARQSCWHFASVKLTTNVKINCIDYILNQYLAFHSGFQQRSSLKGGASPWCFTQEKDNHSLHHNYEEHEWISSKINIMTLYIS